MNNKKRIHTGLMSKVQFDRRLQQDSFRRLLSRSFATSLEPRVFNFGKIDSLNLDHAPTSKGKCFKCRVRIAKGTPRSWYYDKMILKGGAITKKGKNWVTGNKMTVKRLLCYDCTLQRLLDNRDSLKDDVVRLSKEIKRFKRYSRMKKAGRALDSQKIIQALDDSEKKSMVY